MSARSIETQLKLKGEFKSNITKNNPNYTIGQKLNIKRVYKNNLAVFQSINVPGVGAYETVEAGTFKALETKRDKQYDLFMKSKRSKSEIEDSDKFKS